MGVLAPISGHAFTIDSATAINQTFSVNYLLNANATDGNGNTNGTGSAVSGSIIFTLLSFDVTSNQIGLQLNVTNTTSNTGKEVGLQKFAFGTNPDVTGVTFEQINGDANKFISASLDISPEVFNATGKVDLDVESITKTGAPKSLREGQLDIFKLTLEFNDLTNSGVIFNPFSSKWQTKVGSLEFGGTSGGGNPGGPCLPGDTRPECNPSVPEPNELALLGIGLFGMGAMRKFSGRGLKKNT